MPTYIKMPEKLFLVRETSTGKYRTGTNGSAVPKVYKHSPGIQKNEELVAIDISEIIETLD